MARMVFLAALAERVGVSVAGSLAAAVGAFKDESLIIEVGIDVRTALLVGGGIAHRAILRADVAGAVAAHFRGQTSGIALPVEVNRLA